MRTASVSSRRMSRLGSGSSPSRFSLHRAEPGRNRLNSPSSRSISARQARMIDRASPAIGMEKGDVRHRPQGGACPFVTQEAGMCIAGDACGTSRQPAALPRS